MRLVFFGTPEPAVVVLEALVEGGHDIVRVITRPDRRRARGPELLPSPVKEAADRLGLPVATPTSTDEIPSLCAESTAELGVVVAYGRILSDAVLGSFPRGCVNVHYSLLPRWRGAAPVERALLAGDAETGVSIMQLESGLDTGPVWARHVEPVGVTDTTGSLLDRLSTVGARLLLETISRLDDLTAEPQTGEPTYAEKVTVEDFRLRWDQPADLLERIVRAGSPRPGAWTTCDGTRVKVFAARADAASTLPPGELDGDCVGTGDGALQLLRVQPEGKRIMDAAAWLAGRQGRPTRFDS